jgi:hypothetical protein
MWCFVLWEIIDDERAPISAVAALHSGWPFSEEFCVTYAVITSTAGFS